MQQVDQPDERELLGGERGAGERLRAREEVALEVAEAERAAALAYRRRLHALGQQRQAARAQRRDALLQLVRVHVQHVELEQVRQREQRLQRGLVDEVVERELEALPLEPAAGGEHLVVGRDVLEHLDDRARGVEQLQRAAEQHLAVGVDEGARLAGQAVQPDLQQRVHHHLRRHARRGGAAGGAVGGALAVEQFVGEELVGAVEDRLARHEDVAHGWRRPRVSSRWSMLSMSNGLLR